MRRTPLFLLCSLCIMLLGACDAGPETDPPDDPNTVHTYELRVTFEGASEVEVGVSGDAFLDEFTATASFTRTYRGTWLIGVVQVEEGAPVVVVLKRDGIEVDGGSSADSPDDTVIVLG